MFLQIIRINPPSHFGIKKSLRARCQERTPGLQLLAIPVYQLQLGRDCLCVSMGRTQVTTGAGLLMSTDWKNTSYNLTLIIIDRLTRLEDLSRNFVTRSLLEEHQLRSDLGGWEWYTTNQCRYRLMYHDLPDSIVLQGSIVTSKFWSLRYHFQTQLQLPLHIFYENIN